MAYVATCAAGKGDRAESVDVPFRLSDWKHRGKWRSALRHGNGHDCSGPARSSSGGACFGNRPRPLPEPPRVCRRPPRRPDHARGRPPFSRALSVVRGVRATTGGYLTLRVAMSRSACLCFGLSISWFRERSASASASPSRGPGNGILWAETGGRFQPQNAGERPEFGSQTATRLTNRPELRGFLPARKPRRFAGTDAGIKLMAIAAWHPFKTRRGASRI